MDDKLRLAIVQVDKLIALCEEQIKTMRSLRVALLMRLYPNLKWDRDRYECSHWGAAWVRPVALMASKKFKDEQSTARQA